MRFFLAGGSVAAGSEAAAAGSAIGGPATAGTDESTMGVGVMRRAVGTVDTPAAVADDDDMAPPLPSGIGVIVMRRAAGAAAEPEASSGVGAMRRTSTGAAVGADGGPAEPSHSMVAAVAAIPFSAPAGSAGAGLATLRTCRVGSGASDDAPPSAVWEDASLGLAAARFMHSGSASGASGVPRTPGRKRSSMQ